LASTIARDGVLEPARLLELEEAREEDLGSAEVRHGHGGGIEEDQEGVHVAQEGEARRELTRVPDLRHVLAGELGKVEVDVAIVLPAPQAEVQEERLLARCRRREERTTLFVRPVERGADGLELSEGVRPSEAVPREVSAREEEVEHPEVGRLPAAFESEGRELEVSLGDDPGAYVDPLGGDRVVGRRHADSSSPALVAGAHEDARIDRRSPSRDHRQTGSSIGATVDPGEAAHHSLEGGRVAPEGGETDAHEETSLLRVPGETFGAVGSHEVPWSDLGETQETKRLADVALARRLAGPSLVRVHASLLSRGRSRENERPMHKSRGRGGPVDGGPSPGGDARAKFARSNRMRVSGMRRAAGHTRRPSRSEQRLRATR
jgi:hypothetical protein